MATKLPHSGLIIFFIDFFFWVGIIFFFIVGDLLVTILVPLSGAKMALAAVAHLVLDNSLLNIKILYKELLCIFTMT